MQQATKYVAPQIYQWAMEQVEHSPLLPRDVLTMLLSQRLYAFMLPSGRILWPLTAKIDVSNSLDTIAADPGQALIRGPNGWEAYNPPSITGSGAWQLLDDYDVATFGPITELITDVSMWSRVMMIGIDVTCSTSTQRGVQVSDDGGSSYIGTGQYRSISTNGDIAFNNPELRHQAQSTTGARNFVTVIDFLRLANVPKIAESVNNNYNFTIIGGWAGASIGAVTHIRQRPVAGGSATFTGGRLLVLGS